MNLQITIKSHNRKHLYNRELLQYYYVGIDNNIQCTPCASYYEIRFS